jgi:hypothetical protein
MEHHPPGEAIACPANALPRPRSKSSSLRRRFLLGILNWPQVLANLCRYPHSPGNGFAVGQFFQVPYARPGAVAVQDPAPFEAPLPWSNCEELINFFLGP